MKEHNPTSALEADPLRVVIIDDHQLLIDGLMRLLASETGYLVVGTFTQPLTALETVPSLRPDLAVVDLDMPRLGGPELVRRLRHKCPDLKVVILTMHADRQTVQTLLAAGVDGYLLKSDDESDFLRGLAAVGAGKRFYSSAVTDALHDPAQELGMDPQRKAYLLTTREREVLSDIVAGRSTKEIAALHHLAPSTIESHRKSLHRKLDVHSVAGLVRVAIRQNLV